MGGRSSTEQQARREAIQPIQPQACSICMQPMQRHTRLPCGHRLHDGCWRQWQSRARGDATCPLCRAVVPRVAPRPVVRASPTDDDDDDDDQYDALVDLARLLDRQTIEDLAAGRRSPQEVAWRLMRKLFDRDAPDLVDRIDWRDQRLLRIAQQAATGVDMAAVDLSFMPDRAVRTELSDILRSEPIGRLIATIAQAY